MKKLLAITLALIMALTMFAGCSNMAMGFGNYNYKKIHIDTYHYSGCLTVEKWYENESGVGIEIMTKEAGSVFASEGTYILIAGDKGCPFCSNHE